jgi:hypothetical protein
MKFKIALTTLLLTLGLPVLPARSDNCHFIANKVLQEIKSEGVNVVKDEVEVIKTSKYTGNFQFYTLKQLVGMQAYTINLAGDFDLSKSSNDNATRVMEDIGTLSNWARFIFTYCPQVGYISFNHMLGGEGEGETFAYVDGRYFLKVDCWKHKGKKFGRPFKLDNSTCYWIQL